MTRTTGDVVATPSARTYGRSLRQGLPALALLLALIVWRAARDYDSTSGRVAFVGILIGGLALLGLGALGYLKGARVTVTPTEVDAVGLFWRRRRFARTQVAVAVQVAGLKLALGTGSALPMLVLLGHDGRRLLRLSGGWWDTADLDRISRAVGAPVDAAGVVTPKQLRARHPGAVSAWEAHPVVVAVLAGLLVLVLTVVALLLFA